MYSGLSREQQRSRYAAYVRRGVEQPPECPWANAWQGFALGGAEVIEKAKGVLKMTEAKAEVPLSREFLTKPSLEAIKAAAGAAFGQDPAAWKAGNRSDDAGRAVAVHLAYLAFKYKRTEAQAALGYKSGGSVSNAVSRVAGDAGLLAKAQDLAEKLRPAVKAE